MNRCILFFVKYPEVGQVKTRLAQDTSPEEACEFYRASVAHLITVLEDIEDVELVVCYAPESYGHQVKEWLGSERRRLSQKGADLGRRMENAFREAFFMFYDEVILVGSDIPELSADIFPQAFKELSSGKAVLGPARDGGYYLIGFPRDLFVPEVFSDMVWSNSQVLDSTVKRLATCDVEAAMLPEMGDVDTLTDLRGLVERSAPEGTRVLELARKMVEER